MHKSKVSIFQKLHTKVSTLALGNFSSFGF